MMELRECPCCAYGKGEREYAPKRYAVYCNRCGLATRWYRSQQEAEDAWNRRSTAAGPWRPIRELRDTNQNVLLRNQDGVIVIGTVVRGNELLGIDGGGLRPRCDFVAFAEI